MDTGRHAYLITAYDNVYVLERLLGMLDDPRNDIYVHIDAKSRDVDVDALSSACERSAVTFVPRLKVYWGHYSQVKAFLRLMRAASSGGYSYYHLMSGSDLPIKSQDEIHAFFGAHEGTEFVHVIDPHHPEWVERFHLRDRFFLDRGRVVTKVRRRVRDAVAATLSAARRISPGRPDLEIKYGSDWSSLSHSLVLHLLDNEPLIRRLFGRAFIPTEFYVQTLAWNSHFRDSLADPSLGNVRVIDWSRPSTPNGSSPHVWRSEELPELLRSERLFARKFLADVDRGVVDELYALLAPRHRVR